MENMVAMAATLAASFKEPKFGHQFIALITF
jgi:hypothetical protein